MLSIHLYPSSVIWTERNSYRQKNTAVTEAQTRYLLEQVERFLLPEFLTLEYTYQCNHVTLNGWERLVVTADSDHLNIFSLGWVCMFLCFSNLFRNMWHFVRVVGSPASQKLLIPSFMRQFNSHTFISSFPFKNFILKCVLWKTLVRSPGFIFSHLKLSPGQRRHYTNVFRGWGVLHITNLSYVNWWSAPLICNLAVIHTSFIIIHLILLTQ